jgi:hypothetical protein
MQCAALRCRALSPLATLTCSSCRMWASTMLVREKLLRPPLATWEGGCVSVGRRQASRVRRCRGAAVRWFQLLKARDTTRLYY